MASSRAPLLLATLFLAACGQEGIAATTGGPETGPSTTAGSGGSGGDATGAGAGGSAGTGGTGGVGGAGTGGSTTSVGGAGTGGSTTSVGGGGASASSSTTSSVSVGSGGSGGCGPLTQATITPGSGGILLRGLIVNSDLSTPYQGEVFVQGTTIMCVAPSCSSTPGATTATIVDTQGIVMPGFVDTHNHILYDIFDEDDWSPTQLYDNHNQWGSDPRYSDLVDCKQYLNGEGSSADFGCEMDKWGELKGLIAGTTSIVGAASPGDKKCYASLARTIDQSPNDLPDDKVQIATLTPPDTSSIDGVCANFIDGDTTAYLIHIGEGTDTGLIASEFVKLGTASTDDYCAYDPRTTIVHGVCFGDPEFTTMETNGMGLVWSPASNVFLYGAGTDLSATADVPLALSHNLNVSLGPDWSIGGSQNILDELRFAKKVIDDQWPGQITPQMLFQMITANPAKALGLTAYIGSLEVGMRADITVIAGDTSAPYDALLAATPASVRLVLVDGVVLYGDGPLVSLGPATPGCETIDVCCVDKFVCVAETTTTDKLDQTFATIESTLQQALVDYDAMGISTWQFAPLAPLVKCP